MLKINAITCFLFDVGDLIIEEVQMEEIFEGLPRECIPFVMQIYGKSDSPSLYDVKDLMYLHEEQLHNFM